jgi:hypothetical protein
MGRTYEYLFGVLIRKLILSVVAHFLFALAVFFLALDADFCRRSHHNRHTLYFYIGQFQAIHFLSGEAVAL